MGGAPGYLGGVSDEDDTEVLVGCVMNIFTWAYWLSGVGVAVWIARRLRKT